ncbi:MAG: putative DNA binding domain-containing protein [Clostridium sp.]|uniref:RNA-binding domain-containing protein n=1 Tax=Clostridium sp. TaxID=1506 RepID=UPI003032146C
MKLTESQSLELKREFTADLKKEIIAFANSSGGRIYIGVDDNGDVVGIDNIDKVSLQISSMVRDSIKPDITMFINYEFKNIEDKNIIVILIERGTDRPYYIGEKGLKPSGVYVRQGSSSVPASENAIRQMIKETDGDKFENLRSMNQDLSFCSTLNEFKNRSIDLSDTQMKTLGIINEDNLYTNLGLLLSDQCSHTIKVAVFDGIDKSKFKDRREFSGSLLKQLNDVYEYIDIFNKIKAEFLGLQRMDTRDYSSETLREALLNSVVHREYSFSGSTLINIYVDRIEFISIGGLVKGISINDILLGISQARNEKLAAIFYRLRLIEAYGTGISKIMNAYKDFLREPELKVSDNAFVISLPNFNFSSDLIGSENYEENIMEHLTSHQSISRKELEKLFNLGQTMAGRMLKSMVDKDLLKSIGSGSSIRYVKL